MSTARAASCLLVLLAAALVPAAAARLAAGVAAGNPFDICETYNRTTCLEHADKCIPCVAWGKFDTCFETSIAQRLPTKLFTCEFPSPPPPPTESPPPDTDCGSMGDEASCEGASCVWCISAAVPSACYTEAEARRLPAAVFRCKFPSILEQ